MKSVKIKKLHEDASLPFKRKHGLFDVYAGFSPTKPQFEASVLLRHLKPNESFSANWSVTQPTDWVIAPGVSLELNVGFSITLPEDMELAIQGSSTLAARNIIVFQSVKNGGFNGPLTVVVANFNTVPVAICPGDFIASIAIRKVVQDVEVILEETESKQSNVANKKRAKRKTVKCA